MDGLTISGTKQFLDKSINSMTSAEQLKSPAAEAGQKSFAETLTDAISNVNELQKNSDEKIQQLATGRTDDIAGVMITAEKADIALKTMVQVRNKIIDAYQEIMRMQV